jgi:hypothetical protein
MVPTCFGPFGPSSGTIRWNLAKVTVFVEIISKKYIVKIVAVQWQYVLQSVQQCVYWMLCGLSHAAQHPVHTLLYRLKRILPLHCNNFNNEFLLIISTKTLNLTRFRRMLSDDGPSGSKHVGAI